jgi:transcriptional regulator with XRE-family HTH domain
MKRTGPVDHLVGARIRLRRQTIGMTQTELADKIGVTFQQVQKYELGTNRVGASRLAAIAAALEAPVAFFFEEVTPAQGAEMGRDALMEALRDRSTVELVKAFTRISDLGVRRGILELVRSAGGEDDPPEDYDAPSIGRGAVGPARQAGRRPGRPRRLSA